MKILLFGPTGQVGTEIQRHSNLFELVPVTRAECDLRDRQAIRQSILSHRPKVVVNAAAFTAVDAAETNVEECFAINAHAPGAMAEIAAESGALLVHYSTDYVFDGTKEHAYLESDAPNPINVYGRSKLEGERAVTAGTARYIILRTSWVFGAYGKNFMNTILRLAKQKDHLRIVGDQVGAPTSAASIADATVRILRQAWRDELAGIYHMTAAGEVSWHGFATEIVQQAKIEPRPVITSISTEEYPTPAKRPKNSRLSNEKFAAAFRFRLSPWQQQLSETMSSATALNEAVREKRL